MQLEEFDEVATEFGRLVAGTPLEALEDPTPCTAWTVRLLLNHVITGTQWFTTVIEGEEAPDRTIDQVLDDPVSAFARRNGEFRAAISKPGALERAYRHPAGDVPGPMYLRMRGTEFMVHGWDLAQATGQLANFPPQTILGSLAIFREVLARQERGPNRGVGLEVAVPEDAAPLDRLVGLYGRTP